MSSGIVLYLVVMVVMATEASKLCDMCNCRKNVADCKQLGLEKLFDLSDMNVTNEDVVITEANFDHNELVHITQFPVLQLFVLTLSHNKITLIDISSFTNLGNLTKLDLSHNQLTRAALSPDVFQGKFAADNYKPLAALTVLRLGYNAIHSLHPDLFEHLPNLQELYLDSNPITILDVPTVQAICTPAYLKVLDLAYTGIKDLPHHMLHSPRHLEELNLRGNRFTRIHPDLADSLSLQKLILDNNPIAAITTTGGFPELRSLKSLSLTHMPNLTRIESGGLGGLTHLEEFICNYNEHLHTIDGSAFSRVDPSDETRLYAPITKLLLNNNNLSYLESNLVARWDAVLNLDLQENPWSCDCDNQFLVSTLAKLIEANHKDNMKFFTCSYPIEMRGRNISELEHEKYKMRCLDMYNNRPEEDGHLLIGILIGTLLAVPVTLALILAWRRYRHLVFGGQGPADYSRAFYTKAEHSETF